ncbi:hypothetical protein CYMTET_6109 [Cymbomonas tetramitiformis]|uniref:Uncharacterized protein n=1 Tax=Cymbomonas tetramitiformis TaxID=36881 RepID=A0AAE0GXS3_9CHLO|nr:hypothetical protein CYMTET_6109 [Cymbomonas tetramitiformis]
MRGGSLASPRSRRLPPVVPAAVLLRAADAVVWEPTWRCAATLTWRPKARGRRRAAGISSGRASGSPASPAFGSIWNITDGHPSTKGVCPYPCRQFVAPASLLRQNPLMSALRSRIGPLRQTPLPPVRALALQEPKDPAPDSAAADVAVMGFRSVDPSAEAELLATESAEAAVGTSPSTAAFNAMELDIDRRHRLAGIPHGSLGVGHSTLSSKMYRLETFPIV